MNRERAEERNEELVGLLSEEEMIRLERRAEKRGYGELAVWLSAERRARKVEDGFE